MLQRPPAPSMNCIVSQSVSVCYNNIEPLCKFFNASLQINLNTDGNFKLTTCDLPQGKKAFLPIELLVYTGSVT